MAPYPTDATYHKVTREFRVQWSTEMQTGYPDAGNWTLRAMKLYHVIEGPVMLPYTMISPTVPAGPAPPLAACSYAADPPDVMSRTGQPADPFIDFPVRIIF